MGRLIDADAFLKDLEYEGADVCEVYDGGWSAEHGYSSTLVKEVIDRQPTIEAEPVVRCIKCRSCEEMDGAFYCHHWCRNTDENGYCHEGCE